MNEAAKSEADREWTDHLQAAISFGSEAIKRAREALETTTIDDTLRARVCGLATFFGEAQEDSMKAFRKLGPPDCAQKAKS